MDNNLTTYVGGAGLKLALLTTVFVAGSLISVGFAQSKPASSNNDFRVRRGKYLVERVGTCGDCHTPTDQKGQPLPDKLLQGAILMFKPTVPVPGWVAAAPPIAGLPAWTDEQSITFFMTGKKPSGALSGPPMPQLRLNRADAIELTAYLKSLSDKEPSASGAQ